MMSEIYLDSNVYLSIARREPSYEYVMAKIHNLSRAGVVFPHSPAHAEEIATRLYNGKEIDVTLRFKNLISRYDKNKGYFPGCPDIKETEELIVELERGALIDPSLYDAIAIHKKNLHEMRTTNFDWSRLRSRLLEDDFHACLRRVQKYLNLTDVARRNDRFHLGRRNKQSLEKNFRELNISSQGVETFDAIRKKHKLEPRRLANISANEIFEYKNFVEFVKMELTDNGIDFEKIPQGISLSESYYKKEGAITLALNWLEKAGYFQEDKNHAATLDGRMFDVTHAIYAADAKFLVTNDFRFAKKTAATYSFLKIPTQVVIVEDFVGRNF